MSSKVQAALEARKKRKEEEEEKRFSVGDALKKRSSRIESNFGSTLSSFQEEFDREVESYKSLKNLSFGTDLKGVLDSTNESRINLGNLKRKVEAYRKYLGDDKADEIVSYVDQMKSGYDSYLSNAEVYSAFKTEDDYKKWVSDNEEYEKKKTLDLDATQKYIEDLEKQKGEYEKIKYERDTLYNTLVSGWMRAGLRREYAEAKALESSQIVKYDEQLSSYDSLSKELSEKKVTYNQAKRIQEGIRLSGIADPESEFYDPEFDKYSGYVSTKSNAWHAGVTTEYGMGYDDLAYEYINNVDGVRDKVKNKEASSGSGHMLYFDKGYDHLTEQEVAIYNYYYAKDGKEAAEKYLDSIQETLNHRKANERFEGGLKGNTAAELLFGVEAGLDQFASGVRNLFNFTDDYIPTSAVQMASQMVREDLDDDGWKLPEFLGGASLGQVAYDITTTTSNMLPSVLIGSVTHPVVGASLLGGSAAGNAYQEMLNFGYDKGQARMYSTLVGVSEGSLEYLLGGISKLGGKATGGVVTKLLSKIDNAYARAAIRFGGSMLSEGFEEGLQEYLDPWFKSIAFNTDYEAANFDEILYSGLLGALSAFGLEGTHIVGSEVSTYSQGKNLKSDGKVDRLVELGKTFSADTVAYQIANKVNKDTGAYTIGRLLNEVGASLSEANISDITNALVERNFDQSHAASVAKWMANTVNGATLTKRQQAALENNPVIADVWNDVIINPNSTVMQRSMAYKYFSDLSESKSNASDVSELYNDPETVQAIVEEGIAAPEGTQSKVLATEYSEILKNGGTLSPEQVKKLASANEEVYPAEATPDKYGVGVDGKVAIFPDVEGETTKVKTFDKTTGEKVANFKEFSDISQDGKVKKLRLEDGSEIDAKNLNIGSSSDSMLVEGLLNMTVNNAHLDAGTANALLKEMRSNIKATLSNRSALNNLTSVIEGTREALTYGYYGYDLKKTMKANGFVSEISDSLSSTAYVLGKSMGKERRGSDQAKITEAIEARKQSGVEKAEAKGKLRFAEGEKKAMAGLNSDQKAVVDFFRDAAVATPSGMKLIGYDERANGYTNLTTGEMVFSLESNASRDPVAAVLFTAGHESGHYIKLYNPEGFKRLGEFLAKEYGEKGESVHARVLAMQKNSKNKLTYDEAHEEWVCQSLQRMFASVINNKDSGVLQRLQQYDNKVAQLLYKALSKLASRISSLLEKLTPGTFEEQFVAEMDATARQLFEAMYAEELVTAIDNAQWLSGVDVMNDILGNKNIEVGQTSLQEMNRRQTRFQEKTEYEAQPKEIISVGTEAKKPKANRKTLGGKNKVTIAGKTFKGDVSVKELRDARFKENGFSQEEIDKHNEFIQHMADMMKEARVKYRFIGLDDIYNAKILVSPTSGEIVLSALVNNGDYPINFDFTKICKKRVALQQIVDQLARQKGKKNSDGTVTEVNLSPENIKAINDILAEAGIETACLCCFVESKRYNIQSLIQENVIDVWNSIVDEFDPNAGYFNFADESVNESKIPDKEFDALYEQIVAWRKQKGKSSIPKEKMQQFLETTPAARKKLRFSDLVTEKGRTNLHKLYPDIEGLIGSTLGTAAPKSVEAFSPYNGEIDLMESTSETSMRDYLFSIAGARSQSFSDFMIAHIFDVVQKTASLSARKFPAHVYTKEIARARLFGMTGEKHNMSILFNIDPEVDSWNAGLKNDGSYFLSDYKAYKSGESQYIQSIGWDEAVNLQNTEGYSKDCGIIAVGFSYNNMIKIHNDPDVRRVIGYHTSSLPAVVKPLTNLDKATDYTPVQNTLAFVGFVKPMYAIPEGVPSYATPPQDVTPIKGDAKTQKVNDTFDIKATFNKLAKGKKGEARTQAAKETLRQLLEYAESNGLALKTKKAEGGHGDFDLYSDVAKTKNPYMSADHYIEYCIERGYLPAFFEFSMNPNYYKDIFDFNVFDRLSYNPETGLHEDSDGRQAYAPQTAVHMLNEDGSYAFPSDFFEIVDKQMKNYDEYSQMVEAKMPSVMEAITSIDGMTSNLKLQAKELQRKEPTMLTERDLLSLLEFSKAKMLRDGSFIPVRINTPQILIEFAKSFGHTLENHPLAMNVYKARQALSNVENWDGRLQDKPHDLTAEEVVEIIKAMNNPSHLVFQTENDRFAEIVRFVREGEKEKAYAVIDFFDVDKNPELMNGYKGGKYNILVTIYPSENNDELKSYLHNKNHKVITGEEMKKKGLSQRGLGSQVPAHLSDSPFFDDSLSQTTKKSQERKYQDRDSEGNTLSEGQQEFFKDSKVRDENGNLLICYHGTDADFSVFDTNFISADNKLGFGFYFMAGKKLQFSYKHPKTVYLNITNPITDISKKLTRESVTAFCKEIGIEEFQFDDSESDLGIYQRLCYSYKGSVGRFLKSAVRLLGVDGVLSTERSTAVAFDPTQIKTVDNKNPTSDPDIRYQERDQEAEKKVISALKTRASASRILDDYATYTAERMERELNNSSAKGIPDYAKSYITWVDPLDFIYATTISEQNRERIKEEAGEFDFDRLKNETQPIHLTVNFETGEIVGHEGRHRMTALRDQGISYVAVIIDALNDDRHHTKPIEFMHLKGQNFGGQAHGTDMYLHNMLPLSQRYADLARKLFTSNPKSGIRFQERATEDISNRGLLANALESAAAPGEEKNLLRNYKTNIRLIEAEQKKLSEIKDKLFAKGSKIDPDERKKLQFEMKQAANRINSYDRQLLNLEAMQPIKKVLAREKEMAKKRQKQKDMQILADYKEKSKATVRELLERNQESRKKAIEGRDKTLMRHKIKGIVNDLNQLLLKGTKDKHVMIGLQKAVASALDAVNMDTVGADERVAKYDALIAKAKDPDVIASLTETRDRIAEQGDKMSDKLTALKSSYAEIKNSNDPLIANSHDEVIENRIDYVVNRVGNTPLRDMTLEQLEDVYDLYKMVLTTIRNSNKAFKMEKAESISSLGNNIMGEIHSVAGEKQYTLQALEGLKKFGWSSLKPTQAFETIGSGTFKKVFANVRAGEDTWAVDVSEARDYYREKSSKYGYDSWDLDQRYEFTSKSGKKFWLSLEQIMSLYAYSKRKQADLHLDQGGFVFDESIEVVEKKAGIPIKYKVNTANAYSISKEELGNIIGTLSDRQKFFVDEMQAYLSDVMGAKGNEVSLEMYGVKLFKEQFYFPLKSAKQFIFEQNEVAGEVKIKNSGFSKETVDRANNPIILSNFMDVWSKHVNDMSMYHAFVLPLEDFNRVFNYKTPTSDKMDTESVKSYLQNAYGTQPVEYIKQLITDLNGGARSDASAGFVNKGISLFKKGAVFASASVVIQQPSAMARAFAYINPKYFATAKVDLTKHSIDWEECKQYAPVARIKEMGYFDTNVGPQTTEWITSKEYKGFKEKLKGLKDSNYRDEILSKAPALADELAWTHIWNAVKKEIASTTNLKVGSEEFLKRAGERFTEVIVNTQVYDSVLTRSGMMRSKDTGMKMATAFMAEPTTSLNMIVNSVVQAKRGNKKFARNLVGGVAASIILNSILVSLVYAARDDDEDETYAEKYLGSLTSELLDGFNPITYIPFAKDIWSIAQGYDVERSDMSVYSKLWQSVEELFDENKSAYEKVTDFSGSVATLFGLPLKNILRDAEAVYNLATNDIGISDTTGAGVGATVSDALRNSIPLLGRFYEEDTKAKKLYDAILGGDATEIARAKSGYKDQDAIDAAIRTALRENDPRIQEAAQARINGDISKYKSIVKSITAEGNFNQDLVVKAVNAEINKINKEADEADSSSDDEEEESKETSIYKASDINAALENGDTSDALEVINDLVKVKTNNYIAEGKSKKEAEKSAKSSVRSSVTSYWKPLYLAAYKSKNSAEMTRIRKLLKATKLYDNVVETCQDWVKQSKKSN